MKPSFYIRIATIIMVSFFLNSKNVYAQYNYTNSTSYTPNKSKLDTNEFSYIQQLEIFKSLGYEFNQGVTKELIFRIINETTFEENPEEQVISKPFELLYYVFGWSDPELKDYYFSNKCIWWDLEFFDPSSAYKEFMERMGEITDSEIKFTDIEIFTDSKNWEWIKFKVNGKQKSWKLERTDYISDKYIYKFSELTDEFKTMGKYTYYNSGSQQFVIDYATEKEQIEFINKTGLKREWLNFEE